MTMHRHSRREFLWKAPLAFAGAAAFPTIVKASALGRGGAVPPSDRIVMAGIGFGMQGPGNMRSFLGQAGVQWVAVCDLDDEPLKRALDTVNQKYGNKDCATYKDYRELYARGDLDAVSLAIPDHWHAILSIAALRGGMDVFGEKPFTHSLREGRAVCDAVKRYGRVWQTGSWQRSTENFHRAAELVRNGRIGKVLRVEVGLPAGHTDFARTFGQEKIESPPPDFDYDTWLGPAPWSPYCRARVHMNWRWNFDYAGGQLMDSIGHHLDIAHWGLGLDYAGPVQVSATGDFPTTGIYNTPTRYWVDCGLCRRHAVRHCGWLPRDPKRDEVDWRARVGVGGPRRLRRASRSTSSTRSSGSNEIRLQKSRDHQKDFVDAVRSRRLTIAPAEVAHRSASVGHLGVVAMETGRTIR